MSYFFAIQVDIFSAAKKKREVPCLQSYNVYNKLLAIENESANFVAISCV